MIPERDARSANSRRKVVDIVSRTIAVVGGTGPEGMGLALRWARAGEVIRIGSRDTQRAAEAAAQISGRAGGSAQVTGMENSAAVSGADVVILTVPFSARAA